MSDALEVTLDKQDLQLPTTPGQLTYILMTWLAAYFEENGLSYRTITEVLGSIEGLKADLLRRIVTPYEERKQRENGEAWPGGVLDTARHG